MYLNLAFKNVGKSYKDFTIYFLTLTFGVCLFYLFNSVESQGAMLILSESQNDILKMLTKAMDIISVFVAVVLGFLVVYANNFLLKKRKKELGIYMTLGMEKASLLRIVFYETFFIGFISLVAGLCAGIVMSHLFSIITATMFKANLSQFTFIFSGAAFNKTILYFGIIFLIVIVMNMVLISRHQLVHLIQGNRRLKMPSEGKTWLSLLLFVLSLGTLSVAYYVILEEGLRDFNTIAFCMILGALGTYLFFWSVSGLLIGLLKKQKDFYYSHLNMFVFRQFNSRLYTARFTMTIICLMLFLTIGILSTATTISNGFNKDIEKITPYDVTLMGNRGFAEDEFIDYLRTAGLNPEDYMERYTWFDVYKTNQPFKQVFEAARYDMSIVDVEAISGLMIQAVTIEAYNRIRSLQGLDAIELADEEIIVVANNESMLEAWQKVAMKNFSIEFGGVSYKLHEQSIVDMTLTNDIAPYNIGIVVLPKALVQGMEVEESYIAGHYYDNSDVNFELLLQDKVATINAADGYPIREITRLSVYDNSLSIRLLMAYVGLYLGVVFLMSCAAILALGQLSEAADNTRQYLLLSKLGVSRRNMNKAVFVNTFIIFMAPLLLALVHSIFGIELVNQTLNFIGKDSLGDSALYTAAFLVVIYGGYFLATYYGVTNIVIKETSDLTT